MMKKFPYVEIIVAVVAMSMFAGQNVFGETDQSGPAAAHDGASIIEAYNEALLKSLRAYDGEVADLLDDRAEIASKAAYATFNYDWTPLIELGDAKLARLPTRPANRYKDAPVFEKFTKGELAEGLRFGGLGIRFAQKLWDPEATAELFASIALGGGIPDAEQYAKNAIVATMTSATDFGTEWLGEPALGVDKGFWTIFIAYGRDGQGSFLPLMLGVYER